MIRRVDRSSKWHRCLLELLSFVGAKKDIIYKDMKILSVRFAYLCDYEVGSVLNTDQASPRGQDVTSPGPVDTEHRQTRCQQNTWQTLSFREETGSGDALGVHILYNFHSL